MMDSLLITTTQSAHRSFVLRILLLEICKLSSHSFALDALLFSLGLENTGAVTLALNLILKDFTLPFF